MKNIIMQIAISLFLTISAVYANDTACWQHPIYILPLSNAKADALFNSLNQADKNKITSGTLFEGSNELQMKNIPDNNGDNVYEADINNDGKPEIIFVTTVVYAGDGTAVKVTVFSQTDNGLKYLGHPPTNNGTFYLGGSPNKTHGPFYTYSPDNFRTYRFLTNLCGKTYMSFRSNKSFPGSDTYLWKNDHTENACDKDWINYQRFQFQTLYQQHLYNTAEFQYESYNMHNKCRGKINPGVYLSMKNDIVLALLKQNKIRQAQRSISNIEHSPHFAKASKQLKQAVAFNKKLSTQLSPHDAHVVPLPNQPQLSWLLDPNVQNQPEFASQFQNLIVDTVPSIRTYIRGGINDELLSITLNRLFENSKSEIIAHRFVLFSTANNTQSISGNGMALIWIDTQTGGVIIASASEDCALSYTNPGSCYSINVISLVSKYYTATTIPLIAKQQIFAWFKNLKVTQTFPMRTDFYDIEKNKNVRMPKNWWN